MDLFAYCDAIFGKGASNFADTKYFSQKKDISDTIGPICNYKHIMIKPDILNNFD